MNKFSNELRTQNIKKLGTEHFDMIIIGGGINGAGVARDAASRGMKVALVEAKDFASGTSSRSSKMIHGGIRYLANYEFGLVYEALSERQILFEIAPHLVHPVRFLLPLYKGGEVGMGLMGLGMWAYDILSLFQAPEMHERLNPQETLLRMKSLQKKDLLGAYEYSDAYMDDDRLVIETLRSANQLGAVCVNYCKAHQVILNENNEAIGIQVKDVLSDQMFAIQGKHVVSTVGPWTDLVGQEFFKDWKKILRPTKGVHLTFERKSFPLSSAVVMASDSRIVFGVPRHDMVIVGTTDTDFTDDPGSVRANKDDIAYLLKIIHQYFPGAEITQKDIVATYAGVRPLVYDGSKAEGKTSREHTVFTDKHKVTFVCGGKYTTYRRIAEDVLKHCLTYFTIEDRVRFNQNSTEEPLNYHIPADALEHENEIAKQIQDLTKMSWPDCKSLALRHSFEAIEMVQNYRQTTAYATEVWHAVNNTMCLNLTDFMVRRSPLFLGTYDHGKSQLEIVTNAFKESLQLSDAEISKQVDDYFKFIQQDQSALLP